MRDELLDYYESELSFLRQMGAEFAEKYPKVASRLVLGPNIAEDPHVERLIESFAFLAARVHLKVDDDFPEITESLLSVLYPHYIRPVPSMSVVEFAVDPVARQAHHCPQLFLAIPFSIPNRWKAYPVNSAPVTTPPSSLCASRKPNGVRRNC